MRTHSRSSAAGEQQLPCGRTSSGMRYINLHFTYLLTYAGDTYTVTTQASVIVPHWRITVDPRNSYNGDLLPVYAQV